MKGRAAAVVSNETRRPKIQYNARLNSLPKKRYCQSCSGEPAGGLYAYPAELNGLRRSASVSSIRRNTASIASMRSAERTHGVSSSLARPCQAVRAISIARSRTRTASTLLLRFLHLVSQSLRRRHRALSSLPFDENSAKLRPEAVRRTHNGEEFLHEGHPWRILTGRPNRCRTDVYVYGRRRGRRIEGTAETTRTRKVNRSKSRAREGQLWLG